ncbi:MAG: O-antigen ligase family protein [Hyphomicrobium sp.]
MSHSATFPPRHPAALPPLDAQKSTAHRLVLALVAFTVGSGAVVFSEPAPVDAMTMALIVLLPVVGLVAIRPALVGFLSVWLVIAACAFFAASFATDVGEATTHSAVSLYLYLSAFTFAAFVAKSPAAHTKLILNAYQVAALLAAIAGTVGYFDLVPGSQELFTKFGRACGPFKDPNVFGAFLVVALVYELHLAMTRRGFASLTSFAALGVLMFAVLLSLSRGAWAAAGIAVVVYGYLALVTARRDIDRVKLVGLALAGTLSAGLIVAAALQVDTIATLLEHRASLTQTYDEGPDGRFGGQEKARDLILDSPFGIGAMEFSNRHHHEQPHHVYLSMFLNAGWLGGMLYLLMAAATALAGLRHAFRRTASQPLFIVVYAALLATLVEGALIDTDHWRHFYLLVGVVWGLMAGDRRIVRSPRILADRRPLLLRQTIVIPPARRAARLVRPVSRSRPPRRPVRIVARRV